MIHINYQYTLDLRFWLFWVNMSIFLITWLHISGIIVIRGRIAPSPRLRHGHTDRWRPWTRRITLAKLSHCPSDMSDLYFVVNFDYFVYHIKIICICRNFYYCYRALRSDRVYLWRVYYYSNVESVPLCAFRKVPKARRVSSSRNEFVRT